MLDTGHTRIFTINESVNSASNWINCAILILQKLEWNWPLRLAALILAKLKTAISFTCKYNAFLMSKKLTCNFIATKPKANKYCNCNPFVFNWFIMVSFFCSRFLNITIFFPKRFSSEYVRWHAYLFLKNYQMLNAFYEVATFDEKMKHLIEATTW